MCTTVCNYTVITVQNVNFILHSTVVMGIILSIIGNFLSTAQKHNT